MTNVCMYATTAPLYLHSMWERVIPSGHPEVFALDAMYVSERERIQQDARRRFQMEYREWPVCTLGNGPVHLHFRWKYSTDEYQIGGNPHVLLVLRTGLICTACGMVRVSAVKADMKTALKDRFGFSEEKNTPVFGPSPFIASLEEHQRNQNERFERMYALYARAARQEEQPPPKSVPRCGNPYCENEVCKP